MENYAPLKNLCFRGNDENGIKTTFCEPINIGMMGKKQR